jgi:predicted DNA-binding transcriptional regulator AlpA
MTSIPTSPRRALRTTDAARYLGVSASLLRKMRARGPADPLGAGPAYVRLSPSLIVYEIAVLDAWLDSHTCDKGRAA